MEKEIRGKIMEALGEASMCWSEVPKGIFQSDKAIEIGERLVALLASEKQRIMGLIPEEATVIHEEQRGYVKGFNQCRAMVLKLLEATDTEG